MSGPRELASILGTGAETVEKIAPLLADAAAALADVRVPTEADIHDIVAGAYRFTQTSSLESEDTDRRLEETMKNVSKWRVHAQVYLNGASVVLRRAQPKSTRYEAKKRVLAAFRAAHGGLAAERFYFDREAGIELPPGLAAPELPKKIDGKAFLSGADFAALRGARVAELTAEKLDLLVRLLAIILDPRAHDAAAVLDVLSRSGDKATPHVLVALSRPVDAAKSVGGEAGELLIGVRRLLPRLSAASCERVLRAALEAGWIEWIDRPLLDPPLEAALRERFLAEFGTRQQPGGNPYRPAEDWFYNLDPT